MLSEDVKVRIKYHLGYPLIASAPGMSAGVLLATPHLTLLIWSMDHINTQAESMVLELVARCDSLDQQIVDAPIRMQASRVDGVELRADETDALEREYMRQVARLSDVLQAPIFPFSERFQSMPSRSRGPNVGNIQTRYS